MPRIPSAKKRQRQTKVRSARNKAQRSALRTAVKQVSLAGSAAEAAEAFKVASAELDKAGRKNILHRNAAARSKSRLAKLANSKAS